MKLVQRVVRLQPVCKVAVDQFLKPEDVISVRVIEFGADIRVELWLQRIPSYNAIPKTASHSVW